MSTIVEGGSGVDTDPREQASVSTPDLWRHYQATRAESLRNALLERYLWVVRAHARRMFDHLGGQVELDDLLQSGVIGLRQAIRTFDASQGARFETYCAGRVRGAMLDSVRSLLCAPRAVRRRLQALGEARRRLEMELGRTPSEDEIAGRLAVSSESYRELAYVASGYTVSEFPANSREGTGAHEGSQRLLDEVPDSHTPPPDAALQRDDLKEFLARQLTRSQRLVLILYYYEDMTMQEIADTLSVSLSRVSQIHADVITTLRSTLGRRIQDAAGCEARMAGAA